MLISYLKIAFRNLARNKTISLINIFGLAIGITSCVLIFMFIRNEKSYDKKNPNANRIYRIISDIKINDQSDRLSMSSFMLGPVMKTEYPEVEHAIRVMPVGKQTIWNGAQVYQLDDVYFTDSDFFDVLPYRFIEGNPKTALLEPYTIVLTKESAELIFGTTQNILGKMLKFSRASYKVTGVINAPKNESHLNFTALIPMSSLPKTYAQSLKFDWTYMAQENYLMFKTEQQGKDFAYKLKGFEDKHLVPFFKENQLLGSYHISLQKLTDIHLGSRGTHFEYADVGNPGFIYIFSIVAIFILFIACVNYMNMATAKSARRAKEVGIRKTAGADRRQLISQFLGESIVITVISVLLSLCFMELLLPVFNDLTSKSLTINFLDPGLLVFLLCIIIVIGLVSGLYPAFYLSGFQPVEVLKTNNTPKSGHALLRKVLVVAQFCISIVLIAGTLVIWLQMKYVKNKDVGFAKDQVYVIKTPPADSSFKKQYKELKHELLLNPNIKDVAAADYIPGEIGGPMLHFVTTDNKKSQQLMNFMAVDYEYIPLLKIPIIKGRNFSKDFPSDDTAGFIVNEAAINQFGWKDPENVKLSNAMGYDGRVIGVVRNFNYVSLHKPIEPLVLFLSKRLPSNILLKVKPENLPATISFIDNKWKMFSKKYPLESFFLDENFNKQYRADDKLLTLFVYFSALTIIIACLGLLALASFTAEQRTREIGIRKVMGAGVSNIVMLISKDFIILVCIAFVIAAPVIWFVMNRWLQDFAYKISISPWIIMAGGALALAVAMATVSFQAFKAATQNPVKSIKYE